MTILVANVDQTSDSFGGWIAKTNQIADALSTKVVTTESNTAVGNAAITNSFGANALYTNSIAGGNLSSGSANLAISSNLYVVPYPGGNVLVITGNSTTGQYTTTLTGNNVYISPANTIFNGTKINVNVANVFTNAATFRVVANTTLLGNSSVVVVSITGNTSSSNLDIVANTAKITAIANVVGNTTIQANTILNNIKVLGDGSISNVTITANDVWLTPSSNTNIISVLNVTNTAAVGNTTVTGFVNATSSVNALSHTVGTDLIANTTGVYHTGTMNAASFTTTGVRANTTGVFPTSNSSGQVLGNSISRFVVSANTIDASGLITGAAGANIVGTANVGTLLNVGANNTLNATAHIISSNSTVNTVITSTTITQSNTTAVPFVANVTGLFHTGTVNAAVISTAGVAANTTGVFPTSNASGQVLGSSVSRFVVSANTVDASGLITGAAGATITGTTNTTTLYVGVNVLANSTGIYPASNTAGQNIGNTLSRVAVTASTIAASGAAAISNTLATGNTTVTGFVNVSSTLAVTGQSTFSSNIILSGNVGIVANNSTGTSGFLLVSNGSSAYWAAANSLPNVINTASQFVFTNTITIDVSSSTGNNQLLLKSQNIASISIQGDSTGTGTGLDSGAYISLGVDAAADLGIMSLIQSAGNNGLGGAYTGTLTDSMLIGTTSADSLHLGTNNVVTQTISPGGNTGFGNSAPAHKVRVEGTFSALTSIQVGSTFTANATGMYHTGSANAAAATLGGVVANSTSLTTTVPANVASGAFIANTTGIYSTGIISGAGVVANATGVYATGLVDGVQFTTATTTSNSTGFFPASNTSGSTLGNTLARWALTATTVAASGGITAGGDVVSSANVQGAVIKSAAMVANSTGVYPTSNTVGAAFGSTLARWAIVANSLTASANVTAAGYQYSNGASVGIIIYNAAGSVVFPA